MQFVVYRKESKDICPKFQTANHNFEQQFRLFRENNRISIIRIVVYTSMTRITELLCNLPEQTNSYSLPRTDTRENGDSKAILFHYWPRFSPSPLRRTCKCPSRQLWWSWTKVGRCSCYVLFKTWDSNKNREWIGCSSEIANSHRSIYENNSRQKVCEQA